jgi:hypothetical protein
MTTQWLAKQYKATLHDSDMSRGKKLRVLRAIRRELRRSGKGSNGNGNSVGDERMNAVADIVAPWPLARNNVRFRLTD